ncbi:MAG: uracil-DNA glycosylase [Syntrophaceae bacterium]
MNEDHREGKKINCFECRHFFVTHEPFHPYGCRAMGFKARELPCAAVLHSSGEPCLCHVQKGGPDRP